MKSIITLASVAMLSAPVLAQPVINSNNVAPNFSAQLYYAETPPQFSVGQSGPNRIWNFSNIEDGILLGWQNAIPVAGSPYAAEFPLANYCYTMDSAFSETMQYFYSRVTSSAYEVYSYAYGGEVGEGFHQNPRTLVTFPYTYSTVINDTFQSPGQPAVSITTTYDAYGTLIMPFGTFTNVVRQKVIEDGLTNYVWYNVNPFYPILQTALEEDALGYIINHTALGIDDQTANKTLVAYPNPTRDEFRIALPDGFSGAANLNITDLSGKMLLSTPFDSSNPVVDIAKLPEGAYVVRLTADAGTYTGKILKS